MMTGIERPVEAYEGNDGALVIQAVANEDEWIKCGRPAYLPGWE